ncbi:MAG: CapA family protein [Armatimonadetes bacterium]|nr:CapA family protein [Armatimonadota bacterium]CUU37057.1 poly-gamma-glutamate synthesis protein (capsule biosynthesis protein) [Armatimonadetes bacterium DC]
MRLAFAGDIIFGKGIQQVVRLRGMPFLFEAVTPALRACDWVVANMEGCIAMVGTPMDKEYTFRAPPELAATLRWAGIPMVSLGNNHSVDFGVEALQETFHHLRRAGVWWAGAGYDAQDASTPVYLDDGRVRVAIFCFTAVVPRGFPAGAKRAGVATLEMLMPRIREARQQADVLIAIPHWGDEGKTQPNAKQQRIARRLAQAGVDLIVGHHPHVVQGYARMGKTHILYSVGNFVHTPRSAPSRRALLLQAEVGREGIRSLAAVPLWLENGQPRIAGEALSLYP